MFGVSASLTERWKTSNETDYNSSQAEITLTDEDKLLMDQLTSEYRIIQDKIDKIGSFRFTVRGWSVTLVIASIFAVGASKTASPFLLLFLLIFPLLFFLVEQKQNRLGYIFGARALQIEKEIRRIIRSNAASGQVRRDVGFTPSIAYHLSRATARSAPPGRFPQIRKWVRDSDQLFYAVQIIAIIVTVGFLFFVHSGNRSEQAIAPISVVVHENATQPRPSSAQPANLQIQNAKTKTAPQKH